jgi:pyruvate/2-oxoglutarate dehydrogenase complex dihydrolipoamide dehydrogenase (E3) component
MQRSSADPTLKMDRATSELRPDICIIGAGSGGLSVAAAAAAFGQNVVLIEKHKMGGDCLNYGCVPSKALIAAGRRAHAMRTSARFGIANVEPQVDRAAVQAHVRSVIAAIAPNDSVERFTGLGVRVIQAAAKFVDARTVTAGDVQVKARRFVIATGSSPAVPPIPGLSDVPYFTNETIFDNQAVLPHLLIIGGGPIGMELAQANRRLGSKVTVIEAATALSKDDPELTVILLRALRDEGVIIREAAKVIKVEGAGGRIQVSIEVDGKPEIVEGTHLMVAVGRKPNIGDLGLDTAGITYERSGITVDRGLSTSNSRVFAIGDCTGGLQFTHVANYHAGIVIKRSLFRLPAKVNNDIVPWVTYTEPELASVGLTESQAKARGTAYQVLRWPYHENDRAQAERSTHGHVKVIVDKRGVILGAGIVGDHAGELIQIWSLAVAQKLKIKAMTDWISPYPTLGEINKRAAFRYFSAFGSHPMVRRVIRYLAKLG